MGTATAAISLRTSQVTRSPRMRAQALRGTEAMVVVPDARAERCCCSVWGSVTVEEGKADSAWDRGWA
ncbi:hypothetical protein MANAM107_07810 [Actinomyces capricornis]|uniref:Uncharacterized protein n=1 Tax=Actinomyces capricornis TaxID=2755559 RepID=A0ABN6K2X2_9ACTO|nr:hypothetical protein MANAM107_07810 [Actinomyces capricornis]